MAATTGIGSLPNAEVSDDPGVSVVLKAAVALWEDGDTDGALRWLARAAEAAGDVGDDRRALELARAVADLKDELRPRGPSPATTSPAPRATMPPPPSARKPALPPKPPPMRHRSVPPATPRATLSPSSVPPKAAQALDAALPIAAAPANPEAGTMGVRVSVKSSIRDPDLLIVRVLKEGQAAPSGCGEALLAPTGRGFDLANLRG